MEVELALRYSEVLASVIGMPSSTGRREMLDTRMSSEVSFPSFFCFDAVLLLSNALRNPSLDRNRIVESKSSNWIAAVPKT